MSTAIANFGKSFDGIRPIKPKKIRTTISEADPDTSARKWKIVRKMLRYGIIISATVVIFSIVGFAYFYNHYAAIVEQRVRSGFWQSRAGIYAAPIRLMKNQKASRDSVIELLKRSGYVEGISTDEIWNGTFEIRDNAIEVRSNEIYNPQNETTIVNFQANRIVKISSGKASLDEFNIEPEMLTGRTETKRGKNPVLKFEGIPENLKNAILVAEDQRFFDHYGIDPRGIARAAAKNFNEGAIKQGGSTITQQLVKNTFLSPEKTYGRKFAEAFLALSLENKMSKQDIFALYCNEIYLGQYGSTGVHGVEQAANAYFDKELSNLDLNEAAAIAAMIKNPNRFAPHKNENDARMRREWIIRRMAESGLISQADAEAASRTELALATPKISDQTTAPYFVDAVTRELTTKFQNDHLNTNFNTRVYTTIDTHLQNLAERSVSSQLAVLDKIYAKKGSKLEAAVVAIDPQNGHILAMVGGRDYRASQFNRASDALRQPGSTFKPFVYAAALESGMTPISLQADRPTEFEIIGGKPYKPANYGDSYQMENITMKTALAKSSNVIAVKTAFDTGLRRVAAKAEEFGFENIEPYPSLALGAMEVTPLQLAAAYAVFANGGRKVQPTFIDKIVSGGDETLYVAPPSREQIIDEKTAYMITDMLKAVVERGTARKANGALGNDVTFVGKTGSSKDGWFVGYTPNLVTVAWIGTDDSEDLRSTGGELAMPLWIEFMRSVMQTRPEFGGGAFPMPKGMEIVRVDPTTGMIADVHCPMSETVAVSTSVISHIRCLLHQPLPEVLTVSMDETLPTVIEIEPAVVVDVLPENDKDVEKDYKEINGVPTLRNLRKTEIRDKTDGTIEGSPGQTR